MCYETRSDHAHSGPLCPARRAAATDSDYPDGRSTNAVPGFGDEPVSSSPRSEPTVPVRRSSAIAVCCSTRRRSRGLFGLGRPCGFQRCLDGRRASAVNHLVVQTDDLDATIADLAARGVPAEMPAEPEPGLRTAWLTEHRASSTTPAAYTSWGVTSPDRSVADPTGAQPAHGPRQHPPALPVLDPRPQQQVFTAAFDAVFAPTDIQTIKTASSSATTTITVRTAACGRLLPYGHSPIARRPGSARSNDRTASAASSTTISTSRDMCMGFGHPQALSRTRVSRLVDELLGPGWSRGRATPPTGDRPTPCSPTSAVAGCAPPRPPTWPHRRALRSPPQRRGARRHRHRPVAMAHRIRRRVGVHRRPGPGE
jgi:hypothetical protein